MCVDKRRIMMIVMRYEMIGVKNAEHKIISTEL